MQKYNWNYPTTMWVGENRIKDLALACKTLKIKKPLLVTDKGLVNSDIFKNTLQDLKEKEIPTEIYSNVIGNPTGTNVNEGVNFYKEKNVMELLLLVVVVVWMLEKLLLSCLVKFYQYGILRMLVITGEKLIQLI